MRDRAQCRRLAAAAPPLDPPGVRSVSHGLRQMPLSSDDVIDVQNSGTLVLPSTMKPAVRRPFDERIVGAATWSASTLLECVVGRPSASTTSLSEIGTPRNGGSSAPRLPSRGVVRLPGVKRPSVGVDRHVRAQHGIEAVDACEVLPISSVALALP